MKVILIALIFVLLVPGYVAADLESAGNYERTQATLTAGYNWVETEGNSERAAEYLYQDASGTASLDVNGGVGDKHFIINGDYLNKNDFTFNGHFDKNHALRLDLRVEKLFHNLDHFIYDPLNPEGRPDPTTTNTVVPVDRVRYSDANPADQYFLKASTYEAKIRAKLPDLPSHFKVSYWQYKKEGSKQLRFVDEGCSTQCHMQSRTRELDRTTHEISGGLDAHLGPLDLILKHTYRELVISDPVPVDSFNDHLRFRPGSTGTLRDFQHDADPESQMHESTLELHSSLAGGLNLAASGTYGKRINNSKATGVSPIVAEIDYYKIAADLTHTTSGKFSYIFKTRYLDLENENSYPQLLDPFVFDGAGGLDPGNLVDVRPSINIERALYELNATYRPSKKITWKGSVKVEQIKRSETGPAQPFHSDNDSGTAGLQFENDTVWELPDEEVITQLKLSFFARPLETAKFKLNGWYLYKNSNDPAYGNSFADSHQIFLSTIYSTNPNLGISASLRVLSELNKEHSHDVIDETAAPLLAIIPIELDRQRDQQTVNLGLWFNPLQNIFTSFNYGYARTEIRQDLMFGSDPGNSPTGDNYIIVDNDVKYLQEVHSVNANLSAQLTKKFKTRLDLYFTRSLAFYSPDFPTASFNYLTDSAGVGNATSADLKDISRYDIDQYGFRAGIDYYFTDNCELTLDYTYDDYNEKYSNAFDGSVQSAMASFAYRW